ncbi:MULTISPECIES: hypothetical protein [unclassified Streptomyces]|uniref:hypothetical protein n=1 Tax=unclassified Streptomyces TaxID=2593676 RepID=UPI00109EC48C|nr:hypothetical protein [Streptomyces sp. A1136]THA59164.1 hypothetical protein E6R62_00450 [Streptomyces sp. A1136]
MNDARYARVVTAKALTVVCVVLLCVFGAGPSAAAAVESRPATTAPAEPSDGSSDPASDIEARPAPRVFARETAGVRRPPAVFHVKRAAHPPSATPVGAAVAGSSRPTVRSVVLRC